MLGVGGAEAVRGRQHHVLGHERTAALRNLHFHFISIRGVTIPGLESESKSDFHHFSGINNDSNSSKNRFSYCTGIDSGTAIDSKMDSIPILIPIPIPANNGIVTPLISMVLRDYVSLTFFMKPSL